MNIHNITINVHAPETPDKVMDDDIALEIHEAGIGGMLGEIEEMVDDFLVKLRDQFAGSNLRFTRTDH